MASSSRCCAGVGSVARRASRAPCLALTARSRKANAVLASQSPIFRARRMGLSKRSPHLLQESAGIVSIHHPDILDRFMSRQVPGAKDQIPQNGRVTEVTGSGLGVARVVPAMGLGAAHDVV